MRRLSKRQISAIIAAVLAAIFAAVGVKSYKVDPIVIEAAAASVEVALYGEAEADLDAGEHAEQTGFVIQGNGAAPAVR